MTTPIDLDAFREFEVGGWEKVGGAYHRFVGRSLPASSIRSLKRRASLRRQGCWTWRRDPAMWPPAPVSGAPP